jgi:hypothetical protein
MHKTVAEDAYRGNKLYVPGKYTYTQLHTQSAASVPRHSHRAKDLNCPSRAGGRATKIVRKTDPSWALVDEVIGRFHVHVDRINLTRRVFR